MIGASASFYAPRTISFRLESDEENSRHVAGRLGKTLKIAVGDIRFFNRTYLAPGQPRVALIKDFKRAPLDSFRSSNYPGSNCGLLVETHYSSRVTPPEEEL